MSDRREALSRTLDLLGEVVGADRDAIDRALGAARVRLVIDASALVDPPTQAAVYTLAMLLARSGMQLDADLARAPLAVELPGLQGSDFATALAAALPRMFPGARLDRATGAADIVVALGRVRTPPARSTVRLECRGSTATVGRAGGPEWAPLGALPALAAAGLGATEVHKIVLRPLARDRPTPILEPREVTFAVPVVVTGPIDLGDVSAVSGGAITQNMILTLAAEPHLSGTLTVMDRDLAERSNANRCPYLLLDDLGEPKVDGIARWAPSRLGIVPIPYHLDAATAGSIGAGSVMVVGADDIAVRHGAQALDPTWLAIGATSHLLVLVSEHPSAKPCAGCAHSSLGEDVAVIPTMSVVSFWAGYLLALRLIAWGSMSPTPPERMVTTFWPFRPDSTVEHGLAYNPQCPLVDRHPIDPSPRPRAVSTRQSKELVCHDHRSKGCRQPAACQRRTRRPRTVRS